MADNPNVEFEVFKNQFLGKSEGKDGDYDVAFSVNLSQQNLPLPSKIDFYNAYFKNEINGKIYPMTSTDVYSLVGGYLDIQNKNHNVNYQNACAIRGSRGLNYTNNEIAESNATRKGADGKNYIINAKNYNEYLHKKFGNPTYEIHGQNALNLTDVANLLFCLNKFYLTYCFSKGLYIHLSSLIQKI